MVLLLADSWLCCLLVLYAIGLLMFWPIGLVAMIALLTLEPIRSQAFLPGTMDVSPNFYAYRTWGGNWYITQRSHHRKKNMSCKEMQRDFLFDSDLIRLGLPKGKYCTITHAVVLKQLLKTPGICLIKQNAVYKSDLKRILTAMTKNRCKSCNNKCLAYKSEPRSFYKIEFEIKNPCQ